MLPASLEPPFFCVKRDGAVVVLPHAQKDRGVTSAFGEVEALLHHRRGDALTQVRLVDVKLFDLDRRIVVDGEWNLARPSQPGFSVQ